MNPIKLISYLFYIVVSILPWSASWSSQPTTLEGRCLRALEGSRDHFFSSPLTRRDLEIFWRPGERSQLIKEIEGFAKGFPNGSLLRGMRVTREGIERIQLGGMKPSDSIAHKLCFDPDPRIAILHAFMGSRRSNFTYPGPQGDYFAAIFELIAHSERSGDSNWSVSIHEDIPAENLGRIWVFHKMDSRFYLLR